MLTDMRRDVHLSVAAGMFHEWEKEVRDWLSRELGHNFRIEHLGPKIWSVLISDLLDLFTGWGWDPRSLSLFEQIEACRLVVNVYKHGNGKSLEDLKARFPRYLRDAVDGDEETVWAKLADHTRVTVTSDNLRDFQAAFKQFWQSMPENIFWDDSFMIPDLFEKAVKKAV